MKATNQPKCLGKCSTCFYHQINGCIAIAGDDFYLSFSESELQAISNHNYHKSLQANLKFVRTVPVAERIIA